MTQFLASPVPRSALSLQQTETKPGGLSHVGHGLTGSAHRFLIHVCLLLAGDDGGVLVLPYAGPPRHPPLLSVELHQLLSCPAVTAAQLSASPLTTITSARALYESETENTHQKLFLSCFSIPSPKPAPLVPQLGALRHRQLHHHYQPFMPLCLNSVYFLVYFFNNKIAVVVKQYKHIERS